MQEEIKIISVTVFVNPYTEPDEEEEEEKGKNEKNAEDEENVSFFICLYENADFFGSLSVLFLNF